jgi:hypothetical protein
MATIGAPYIRLRTVAKAEPGEEATCGSSVLKVDTASLAGQPYGIARTRAGVGRQTINAPAHSRDG